MAYRPAKNASRARSSPLCCGELQFSVPCSGFDERMPCLPPGRLLSKRGVEKQGGKSVSIPEAAEGVKPRGRAGNVNSFVSAAKEHPLLHSDSYKQRPHRGCAPCWPDSKRRPWASSSLSPPGSFSQWRLVVRVTKGRAGSSQRKKWNRSSRPFWRQSVPSPGPSLAHKRKRCYPCGLALE